MYVWRFTPFHTEEEEAVSTNLSSAGTSGVYPSNWRRERKPLIAAILPACRTPKLTGARRISARPVQRLVRPNSPPSHTLPHSVHMVAQVSLPFNDFDDQLLERWSTLPSGYRPDGYGCADGV
jgi:hypothetical protein